MSVSESLQKIDKKYPSSFLGLIVGLLIGAVGIYLTMFYEKQPEVTFETLSIFRVYDIREEIGALEILFDGENIKKKNETLSLITLKVANTGQLDILKTYFDENDLLGIKIKGSRIIKFNILSASNDYIREALRIEQTNPETLLIYPIILEKRQSITLKILILHPETISPSVLPIGKIAGIQQLKRQEELGVGKEQSFWSKTYRGNLSVQALRALSYGIGTILVLIGLAISISSLSDRWTEHKRRKFVKMFEKMKERNFSEKENKIFDVYVRRGEHFIIELEKTILNKRILKKEIRTAQQNEKNYKDITMMPMHFYPDYTGRFLLDNKIVEISKNEIICDQEVLDTVKQFVMFLNAHIPKKIKSAKRMFMLDDSLKSPSNQTQQESELAEADIEEDFTSPK